jgi:alkylhydroperoxidase family enzyme
MGELNDCHYCLAAHTVVASMAGVDAEEAVKIRKAEPTDSKHAALIAFVKAVLDTKGYVSDVQLQAIREAGYTDGQIVEIIGGIAQNTFTNLFNHVNDTEIDFPAAPAL